MMNKRAPRRSDEEWHQIIFVARAFGLSDFEYCGNNSILRWGQTFERQTFEL